MQSVRVLGKCGGTTEDIIDAIRWAAGIEVQGVPVNETPAKVINMSLGASGVNCPTQDQATNAAIRDAVTIGKASVVVAAGNDAIDASQATRPVVTMRLPSRQVTLVVIWSRGIQTSARLSISWRQVVTGQEGMPTVY